jgi:glucan biosynthesis protein C
MLQKRTQDRLLALDFVRVAALLGVVIYHSAAAYSTNTPYWSVHDATSVFATGTRELVDVFIMPIFFFPAGYFTIYSLRRTQFMKGYEALIYQLIDWLSF